MKKILIGCFLFLPGSKMIHAQGFLSGTIRYELNYHIPEQGRKAMEKSGFAVTTGMEIEGDGSGLNIKILSANGVKMEILYTRNFSCYIDRPNRKAYKMPDTNMAAMGGRPTVTKTEEFETILGHRCRKYIIEHDGGITQFVWACPDYKVAYGIYEHISGNSTGDESYTKEIDGVPLKITSGNEKTTFEMKTLSIDDHKHEASDFTLPTDFVILPYDPVVVGKMLMGEQ